jgi:putative transposase
MRTSHYYRLARHIQEQTTTLLQRLFQPADYSARCTAWVLLSSLVLAAANRLSLAAVAALRPRSPSRETLRQAFFATLPSYTELRQHLARVCRQSLPRGLRRRGRPRRRYPLAIDIHSVAYFKRQRPLPPHVRGGAPQPGTSYGHFYATASLLRKGQYFVVALTPYDPDQNQADLVRTLLRQATANGFPARYILLDRGFWSTAVLAYLQHARYPFLIPVVARGRQPTTGTRKFFHGCKTGWYTYRLTQRHGQRSVTVTIAVQRRNWAGHKGKRGRYAWVYALWRMDLSTVQWVRQSYRRRFRIESSYRLLEAARGRTSSRDEGWRLWYVVLAVLLLNAWLALRRQAGRPGARSRGEWYWWNRLLLALTYVLLLDAAALASRADTINPQLRE